MRTILPALALLALTGCHPPSKPEISTEIRPQEYALYHAWLEQNRPQHPSNSHYYIDGLTHFPTSIPTNVQLQAVPAVRAAAEKQPCMPADVEAEFRADPNFHTLNASSPAGWLTLSSGPPFQVVYPGKDHVERLEIPYVRVSFSRVIFRNNGSEAWFEASVGHCDPLCGGSGAIFHTTRTGNTWAFHPTTCSWMA